MFDSPVSAHQLLDSHKIVSWESDFFIRVYLEHLSKSVTNVLRYAWLEKTVLYALVNNYYDLYSAENINA